MVGVHGDQPVRAVHEPLGLAIPQSILYSCIVVVPILHFAVCSVEGQVVGSGGCPDSTLLCLECRIPLCEVSESTLGMWSP